MKNFWDPHEESEFEIEDYAKGKLIYDLMPRYKRWMGKIRTMYTLNTFSHRLSFIIQLSCFFPMFWIVWKNGDPTEVIIGLIFFWVLYVQMEAKQSFIKKVGRAVRSKEYNNNLPSWMESHIST